MAEQTTDKTYVIPLRDAWRQKADYKKTRAAVQEVKRFVARHMKLQGDVDRVRVDIHLNNEMWFRGSRKPPARIAVKVRRVGENVLVMLAEEREHIGFAKARHVKRHVKSSAPKVKAKEKEKTEQEKNDEQEKEKAVAISNEQRAEQAARSVKHTTKVKTPKIHRMALQK